MAGLLTNLRDRFRNLYAALLTPEPPAMRTREKVAAGPRGIILPQFLPYYTDSSGETLAMRRAYRQHMFNDPNIKPALHGKILSVGALDVNFTPANEDDAESKRLAKFAEWQFTERIAGGIPELAWNILSGGLVDGYSVNERVWAVEVGGDWHMKHVLRCLKPKQVDEDVILLADEFRNVVGIQGLRWNPGQVFHPEDFVIWRNLGMYDSPTGTSDLRAAYGRFWILDSVVKLRAIGAEKRAFPVLVGHYTDASDQPGLEEVLASVKSSNWFTAPESARIEALDIAGRADTYFQSFVKDLRDEIISSIAGALLQQTTGGEGVQRGASSVHKDTADLFRWWLVQSLTNVFNDCERGLIRSVIDPNFANVRHYPKITFGGVDEAELGESLKVDLGLAQLGWKSSRKDLAKRYGRQWAIDDADVVTPPQPAPPPAPFDEGGTAGPAVPAPVPFRFAEGWHPDDFQWGE